MTVGQHDPRTAIDLPPLIAESSPDDLSSHRHRLLIGVLGLLLPLLLWLVAAWRAAGRPDLWVLQDSVSAYYHTGAVAVFVGVLAALAVFFLTYRGYGNEFRRRDTRAANVAGVAAIGVAFFPTAVPVGVRPEWWTERMGQVHFASAAILLLALIYFSAFLFPMTGKTAGAGIPLDKRVRNHIYRFCGAAMLVNVLWAAYATWRGAPIFWAETLALEFFALSWLVKGQADRTALAVGRRVMHYGRNPGRIVPDLRRPRRD